MVYLAHVEFVGVLRADLQDGLGDVELGLAGDSDVRAGVEGGREDAVAIPEEYELVREQQLWEEVSGGKLWLHERLWSVGKHAEVAEFGGLEDCPVGGVVGVEPDVKAGEVWLQLVGRGSKEAPEEWRKRVLMWSSDGEHKK